MCKKYHGFTCPNCGSHMFGTTFIRKGIAVGKCHENQYSKNGCTFEWDRHDPIQEGSCMHEMTAEEWAETFNKEVSASE